MSDLPRVYITRRLPQSALDLLSQHVRATVWPGELPPPRAVLMKEVAQVDGVLALPADRIDAALFDSAPHLQVVSNLGPDCDNVDMAAANRRGVLVATTPGILAETTADFTFALMLAASRRVVEAEHVVRSGRWRSWGPEVLLGRDLHGATLGIVGMGQVGQAVARRAAGFGMRVLFYTSHRRIEDEREDGPTYASLERLLAESDIVSLHCPINDETYQLIDRDALALMKPDAILVNTAHGLIVDTKALLETLRHKAIVAALDVTDPEPLPADHPLLALPNVLVTPHIASASVATRTRMALLAAENLLEALRGERPRHLVNVEAWQERMISVGGA
ncbi:MAG TPA: D-glycerate dehydrogenase [Roseiflexaceae bacterium]|nr:D-glycerate dehydrogenase [Roseiflexaceae bacterium]